MPKKNTKILIFSLLILDVFVMAAFIFLFNFTKSLIAESVHNENELKNELTKDDTRVLMKQDLILGASYQKELSDYMIPSGGTIEFIKTIEKLVSDSKLKSDIKSVSNEPYDRGAAIGTELLKINMDIIGEWKNVQFFLKLLENYPLKIDIKRIAFTKSSDYIINGKKVPQWFGGIEFTVVKLKDIK